MVAVGLAAVTQFRDRCFLWGFSILAAAAGEGLVFPSGSASHFRFGSPGKLALFRVISVLVTVTVISPVHGKLLGYSPVGGGQSQRPVAKNTTYSVLTNISRFMFGREKKNVTGYFSFRVLVRLPLLLKRSHLFFRFLERPRIDAVENDEEKSWLKHNLIIENSIPGAAISELGDRRLLGYTCLEGEVRGQLEIGIFQKRQGWPKERFGHL